MDSGIEQALITAAARGDLPIVQRLLDEGVPVDAANEVGYTALMAAARTYRLEVLTFLLRYGADVHLRGEDGHTPLHWAVGSPSDESASAPHTQAECVRLLLAHGAIVDATKHGEGTPLMSAAWFGCTPSVVCLLHAGADSTRRDSRGRTAADLARERHHTAIVDLLSPSTVTSVAAPPNNALQRTATGGWLSRVFHAFFRR